MYQLILYKIYLFFPNYSGNRETKMKFYFGIFSNPLADAIYVNILGFEEYDENKQNQNKKA